jgi:hypothetical protein
MQKVAKKETPTNASIQNDSHLPAFASWLRHRGNLEIHLALSNLKGVNLPSATSRKLQTSVRHAFLKILQNEVRCDHRRETLEDELPGLTWKGEDKMLESHFWISWPMRE